MNNNHKKIALERCLSLDENTPEQATTASPYTLPPDFPDVLISADDMLAVREWWTTTVQSFLERLRDCMTHNTTSSPGLKGFTRNALSLSNLLALHPCTSGTIFTLAKEHGLDFKSLAKVQAAQRRILAGGAPTTSTFRPANPSIPLLKAAVPQLNFTARQGKHPVIIVPFAQKLTLLEQWDTVLTLSQYPGISATLELTAQQQDAVRITFHPHGPKGR